MKVVFSLPTTCKYPYCVLAVTVLIWHMYFPLSSSCTSLICRYHVLCLSCDTAILGFLVITWLCTVRIALWSKSIQATWKEKIDRSSKCSLVNQILSNRQNNEPTIKDLYRTSSNLVPQNVAYGGSKKQS